MKILLVIDSMGSGGAQRILVNLINGLTYSGKEIYLFVFNSKSSYFLTEEIKKKVNLIEIFRKNDGFSLSVLFRLIKLYYSDEFTVFSFQMNGNIYCLMARFFMWRTKVISVELSVTNPAESKIKRILSNFFLPFASTIYCNSKTQTKYLTEKLGLKHKVFTVWNGYNIQDFPFKYKKFRGLKTICIIGRVAYPKNGLLLLNALDLYYKKYQTLPKVRWVGRFDTDPRSVKMQNEMNQFISSRIYLQKCWDWSGEIKDIKSVFNTSDVMVLTSRYEGLPNVICESMLLGCPVIATSVSDNAYILGRKRERGILCKPNSPRSLLKALEYLESLSSQKHINMVREAREFAQTNFNLEIMVHKYLSKV